MKRVNHMLTEKQVETLHSLSDETGLSLSEIIRRALDAYITTRSGVRDRDSKTEKKEESKV